MNVLRNVLSGCVCAASWLTSAHANADESIKGDERREDKEESAGIGRAGRVILPRVFGYSNAWFGARYGEQPFGFTGQTTGATRYTSVTIAPVLDVMVTNNVSLGGGVSWGYSGDRAEIRYENVASNTRDRFYGSGLQARVGYVAPLLSGVDLWTMLGTGAAHWIRKSESSSTNQAASSPAQRATATVMTATLSSSFTFRFAKHLLADIGVDLSAHAAHDERNWGIDLQPHGGLGLTF